MCAIRSDKVFRKVCLLEIELLRKHFDTSTVVLPYGDKLRPKIDADQPCLQCFPEKQFVQLALCEVEKP